MKSTSIVACLILAAGAALPSAVHAEPEARFMPVEAACPAVLASLPEQLNPAWLALNAATQVTVDFKLDGKTIRDVRVSGHHGEYARHVRSAVRAMHCQAGPEGNAVVRFRIEFVYPEDQPGSTRAVRV